MFRELAHCRKTANVHKMSKNCPKMFCEFGPMY